MFKIAGLILNTLGVLALWFGGVPYKTKQTLVDIGPLKAHAEVDKTLDIPPPFGAGAVGVGSLLLMVPGRRRKKD